MASGLETSPMELYIAAIVAIVAIVVVPKEH